VTEGDGRHADSTNPPVSLADLLARKVVGQPAALTRIVPFVQMYQARLSPPDRPAGIFLLLGPTGTGKTRTVEALAEILHGSPKHLLKVDCAEYQSDHEVAKLIGAPPGYVGHRETKPVLTRDSLLAAVSPRSDLAIVLFDEIEKAAPSFTALLLGVLDRATLRLGDNTEVNFEKSLIFLTSNLGAREMMRVVQPNIGFQVERRSPASIAARLEAAGMQAVRRRFSPEFVNRIDVVLTYRPLDAAALEAILDHQVSELQQHVRSRLGERSFDVEVSPLARQRLLARGTSEQYGARELRRTVHRLLTQPLAALVADGDVPPGSLVHVDAADEGDGLTLRQEASASRAHESLPRPTVLAVDENEHLLTWMATALSGAGMTVMTAATAQAARDLAAGQRPDLVVVDIVLPDADGLTLALELVRKYPRLQVVATTGMELTSDEAELCDRQQFPVLRKPFLPEDVVSAVWARVRRAASAGR
jgi:ATP-dependent Clp protease ATP-binding subunit ClpA/ActR/RegA family two-component response regulator